jgi:hypothetical protein
METRSKQTLLEQIKKIIQAFSGEESHPSTTWNVMIIVFFVALVISAIISISTYRRITLSIPIDPPKIERGVTISHEEIQRVIELYDAKNKEFTDLQAGKLISSPKLLRSVNDVTQPTQPNTDTPRLDN